MSPAPAGGFDVFDVHHHVGRPFDALGGALDPDSDGTGAVEVAEVEARLRIMDALSLIHI